MNTSPVGSFLQNFTSSFMMMYQFGKQQELANKRLAAEERTAKMREASFALEFARATKAPPDIKPYNQTGLLPQQGAVTLAGTTGLLGSVNAPKIGQSAEFDLPRPQIKGDPAFYATLQTKLDETKQIMQSAQARLKAKQAQFVKETEISVNLMKDNIGNVNAGAIDLKKVGLSEETQAVVNAVWGMDEKNQAKIAKGMQTVFDIMKNPSATKEDVYTRIAQFSGYPDIYNILTTRADNFYAEAKELRTGVLFGSTLDGVMGYLNMFREGTAKNLPDDQTTAVRNLSSNLMALGEVSPSLALGLIKIITAHDEKMKPKKYEENTKEVHLGGGKWQEMQLDPETGRYNIPVGQPHTQAQKAKPSEGEIIRPQEALKRITELEKLKVNLKATGGASDIALLRAKDYPKLLKKLQGGDITGAMAQIDREIEFMEKHTGGSKKKASPIKEQKEQYEIGETYVDAQGKKAKYLGGGKWQIVK